MIRSLFQWTCYQVTRLFKLNCRRRRRWWRCCCFVRFINWHNRVWWRRTNTPRRSTTNYLTNVCFDLPENHSFLSNDRPINNIMTWRMYLYVKRRKRLFYIINVTRAIGFGFLSSIMRDSKETNTHVFDSFEKSDRIVGEIDLSRQNQSTINAIRTMLQFIIRSLFPSPFSSVDFSVIVVFFRNLNVRRLHNEGRVWLCRRSICDQVLASNFVIDKKKFRRRMMRHRSSQLRSCGWHCLVELFLLE